LSNNTWTKKSAEQLKNLNYFRNSIESMKCMTAISDDEALRDKLRQTEILVHCIESALKLMTDEELFFLENFFIRHGDRPLTTSVQNASWKKAMSTVCGKERWKSSPWQCTADCNRIKDLQELYCQGSH